MRALWVTTLKQDGFRRVIRPMNPPLKSAPLKPAGLKAMPLAAALIMLFAVGAMAARVQAAPKNRPNIVFIMADDK